MAAAGAGGGASGASGSNSVVRKRKLPAIELKKPISEMQGATYVFTLFSDPVACKPARLYTIAMNITVFISTWVLVVETLRPQYTLIYFLMDTCFVGFFTFDLIVRCLTCPSQKAFWSDPLNILDFITTFPYYLQPVTGIMYNTAQGMQRCLRAFRHMKMIKVTKYGPVMIALEIAMVKSLAALIVPIFYMALALVVLSSLEYFIEMDDTPPFDVEDQGWDPFNRPTYDDLPSAIWWCLVTMTGTGYGDMYPAKWHGMMVAAVTAAIGVFFIAMPFAVAGGSFWHAWSIYTEQRELLRLMKEGDTSVELTPDELGFQPGREISLMKNWWQSNVMLIDLLDAKAEEELMSDDKVNSTTEMVSDFAKQLCKMLDTIHEETRHKLVIREWNRARLLAIEKRQTKMPPKPKEISYDEAMKVSNGEYVPSPDDDYVPEDSTENPLNSVNEVQVNVDTTGKMTGDAQEVGDSMVSREATADALLGQE